MMWLHVNSLEMETSRVRLNNCLLFCGVCAGNLTDRNYVAQETTCVSVHIYKVSIIKGNATRLQHPASGTSFFIWRREPAVSPSLFSFLCHQVERKTKVRVYSISEQCKKKQGREEEDAVLLFPALCPCSSLIVLCQLAGISTLQSQKHREKCENGWSRFVQLYHVVCVVVDELASRLLQKKQKKYLNIICAAFYISFLFVSSFLFSLYA